MTTIPDDMVERVARAIADKMHAGGDFGMTGADAYRRRSAEFMSMARAAIEAMQPAILAERERCARIAERYGAERAGASDGQTCILLEVNGRDVAHAIRSQS